MKKDRNLSKLDFMEALQQEFFAAEIRSKIHYKPSNKKYWKKVMDGKKEKIKSIADELKIASIFDENEYYTKTRESIYPDKHNRMPYFSMTTEEIELYFSSKSQVKVFDENGEFYLGSIHSVNLQKNILHVKKRGTNVVELVYITRVMRLI